MDRERRSPYLKSRSACPINGQGSGANVPMCSYAFSEAGSSAEHLMPGSARERPVRRAAHPLRSLTR